MDWSTRSVRTKARLVEERSNVLTTQLRRTATGSRPTRRKAAYFVSIAAVSSHRSELTLPACAGSFALRPTERLTSRTSPRGTGRIRADRGDTGTNAPPGEVCPSIMCSLKTEQRKVQKRVRASAPVASASGVDVHVNIRIILMDNNPAF